MLPSFPCIFITQRVPRDNLAYIWWGFWLPWHLHQVNGQRQFFPFGQTDLLKTLFQQRKQCGGIALLVHRQARNNLRLEVGEHCASKNSGPKHALSDVMLPVNSFPFTVKDIFIWSGCFKPSLIVQSGNPSGPREVYLLYQLNWGVNIWPWGDQTWSCCWNHCWRSITVT